jgi:hypothetical protein
MEKNEPLNDYEFSKLYQGDFMQPDAQKLEIDVSKIDKDNPVLKRLIEEVKEERKGNPAAYNRLHNRHNRSSPSWPRPKPEPEPEPKPEPPSTET